jgi:DNA polymerase III alpha subunit
LEKDRTMPDIDIDFKDREQALSLLKYSSASREEDGKLVKHNTGVYLHEVPIDPITGICQIPYDRAEEQGFFKIDFLNFGLYDGIRDEDHLINLVNTEPLWDLLQQQDFVSMLYHVHDHCEILKKLKPKSIEELAAVLAIIRPAKRHLIDQSWDTIMKEIWVDPKNGEYFFKKSHATSYAIAVVVQMNLICEQISYGYS